LHLQHKQQKPWLKSKPSKEDAKDKDFNLSSDLLFDFDVSFEVDAMLSCHFVLVATH